MREEARAASQAVLRKFQSGLVDLAARGGNRIVTGRERSRKRPQLLGAESAGKCENKIDELPADSLNGAYLQVEEARFDQSGIRSLYESEAFPLPRRPRSPASAEDKADAA